jgi:hypothetical protein
MDMIGIVTALDGQPLPSGDIASRLGGFTDIGALETHADTNDAKLIETILGSHNDKRNNYQDFQKFLDAGGRIGLQYDPLLYGAFNLNPFLVRPGCGDQGVRRSADTGHFGRRFQIRESGPARPPRHLAGASANREVSHQSALLPGGGSADVHHYAELGGRRVPGPQSRRKTDADRSEEQRGIHVCHRPTGSDSHPRYDGALRDLHDGQRGESGQ